MDNGYVPLCSQDDIPNGGRKSVTVAGESLIVFNINRQFFAVKNRCTHLDFPLNDGRQVGTQIMCRQHGARFDVRTGEVLGGPAVHDLQTYPVKLVDGRVMVKI